MRATVEHGRRKSNETITWRPDDWAFLTIVGARYSMRDIGNTIDIAYNHFISAIEADGSFRSIIDTLSRYVPEGAPDEYFDFANSNLTNWLMQSRKNIDGWNRTNSLRDEHDLSLYQAKSQEISWLIASVNYKWIIDVLNRLGFNDLNDNNKYDVFIDALSHVQKHFVQDYDPKIGAVTTYIKAILDRNGKRMIHRVNIEDTSNMIYRHFIKEAQAMTSRLPKIFLNYPNVTKLLACFLIDEHQGRLTYTNFISAFGEYIAVFQRRDVESWDVVRWKNPYKEFGKAVERKMNRITVAVEMGNWWELDEEQVIFSRDSFGEFGPREVVYEIPDRDGVDVELQVADRIRDKLLHEAIATSSRLSLRERDCLQKYYFEEWSRSDLARYYGFKSDGPIRRILNSAINKVYRTQHKHALIDG
jgi:hypothetical protein